LDNVDWTYGNRSIAEEAIDKVKEFVSAIKIFDTNEDYSGLVSVAKSCNYKSVTVCQGWALFFFRAPHKFFYWSEVRKHFFEVNLSQKTYSKQINTVINLNIT